MTSRSIRAPRGTTLSCKGWHQEAALRCLMNNLDREVAEKPDELIVYGGTGKAARNWNSFDAIVRSLQNLENDETLLVQSGKPVGIFRTHEHAPRVLIANSNLVGAWANWDRFHELERKGLIDRKSTRLNSSHMSISYAVFCLKKKKIKIMTLSSSSEKNKKKKK